MTTPKSFATFLAILIVGCATTHAADWLTLPAKSGISNGKNIIFISGDEEYRSEESCPMLAKILSQKFGFNCIVLFAINPNRSVQRANPVSVVVVALQDDELAR
jgi:predicted component of type VI protein secretion system